MTETVELSAGSARVVIAPAVGGSIAAFECGGQAILRPTPSRALTEGAVRDFACFPLIPFSNRIADATLHWAGREYALTRYVDAEPHAIHGNGWQRTWSVTRREASRLAIELEHDATGVRAREWPFPYRARQRFDLVVDASAVRLELGLEIENTGGQPFPSAWDGIPISIATKRPSSVSRRAASGTPMLRACRHGSTRYRRSGISIRRVPSVPASSITALPAGGGR